MREEVKISSIHAPINFKPSDRVKLGVVTGVDKPGGRNPRRLWGAALAALARPFLSDAPHSPTDPTQKCTPAGFHSHQILIETDNIFCEALASLESCWGVCIPDLN